MGLFFRNKPGPATLPGESATALKMVVDGKERDVSFAELTLSNNLSQQALARLLIKKGMITAQELLEMIKTVRKENYRTPDNL